MVKKIFGVIFILAGIGNFMGNVAKSQTGSDSGGSDIAYGIFFLGLGLFLLLWNSAKSDTKDS